MQSQIDAAKKAVDKITKKKPQISTNKSAYLEAKKKWEGELREAERKALYWNDVKAEVEKITTPADERTDDNSGSDENIEWAEGKDFKEVIEHFGNIPEPIAVMPQIVRKNVQSLDADYLYCGKAYMIDHQANHHPELDKTNTSIFRQFLTVMTISRICLMVVI